MYFRRLEDLRIDADKTQQEVADYLNCKREVYRRYEKGIYIPPLWFLQEVAAFYGINIDILVNEDLQGRE